MGPELWAALGTATLNQGGNIISTAMANHANERMQQRQNAWNLEQWNRNNAYNHPAAQMQRLKAAGLNPDLMYGQNAGGAMGNSSSPAQGSNPIPKQSFRMDLDPTMFAQLDLIKAQKENINADTKVKLADAEGRQQNNFINQLNVEKTKVILDHFRSLMKGDRGDEGHPIFGKIIDAWEGSIYEEAAAHLGNTAHYNEQYWQSSANIATILYTLYGVEFNSPLAIGGDFPFEEFIGYLKKQGVDYRKINEAYKSKIIGQLNDGNEEMVKQQLQILIKTSENLSGEREIQKAQKAILDIEEKLKKQELNFQKWFNSEEEISILGITLTPREFCVVAPVLSGLLNAGGEVIQGLGNVAKSVAKGGKGKTPAPTNKTTYETKYTNVYNYGVPQH